MVAGPRTAPPIEASPSTQGGSAGVGAGVAIGIALLNEVKQAIQSLGTAAVYVKAKTDGPDSDDRAIDFDFDRDRGLDWSLDQWTQVVTGENNDDDGEETPYTPGDEHHAYIELHFESTGGQWKPDPDDCRLCPASKKQECYGWVSAKPEDDPTKKDQKTFAVAAAAFSADGKTVDFCYRANTSTTPEGGTTYENPEKVDCSPVPEFALQEGAAFLASIDRFAFEGLGDDEVVIRPMFGPTIDLFHSYLQQDINLSILPVLRGHDDQVQELKRDAYLKRIDGTSWSLSESPGELADLTIVGAAIHFDELTLTRAGRSNAELLEEYFQSSAVGIVAPEHAQRDYQPQVMFRQQIKSGEDITAIIGRPFVIPVNGDPSEIVEEDPLVGLVLGVEGGIDQAVATALNTEQHFVRDLANAAWDGTSYTVDFTIPGLNFHYENPSSLSDIAVASPTVGGTTELLVSGSDAAARSAEGSSSSDPPYAAIAVAAAAASVAVVAAGGWYVRRRWLR